MTPAARAPDERGQFNREDGTQVSRRSGLYRDRRGKSVDETVSAILSGHRKAIGKLSGKVCSLPMKPETAQRIAGALHRPGK